MPPDRLPDPWHAFLAEIDGAAPEPIELQCIGGFAVSLYYGLDRPTGDIDIVEVKPQSLKAWLAHTAGAGTPLHRQHKVYLQIVTVASIPEDYESRLIEVFPGQFPRLRLFVTDPYDLALSKLARNWDLDMDDVKHLAKSCRLDLAVLEARYRQELRPIVIGPPTRHDETLRLWMDAITEDRNAG